MINLIKLLYSVIVSGISSVIDWLDSPSGDIYRWLLYPERPDGLEEESYECAKLWHIFWNTQRVKLEKRRRWVNNVRIFEGSMKDIKPTQGKTEEYDLYVLINFKMDRLISLNSIEIDSKIDTKDFSLYQWFDSTEREVEGKRSITPIQAERYLKKLKELWGNRVQEQRENERIRKENEKILYEHYCRHEERRRNEPRGLFWPFG